MVSDPIYSTPFIRFIYSIDEIKRALAIYREVIPKTKDAQAIEDYSNFAAKTDGLITAIETSNLADTKLRLYDMTRALSDYWSRQPPEYFPLGDAIEKVEKIVKKCRPRGASWIQLRSATTE